MEELDTSSNSAASEEQKSSEIKTIEESTASGEQPTNRQNSRFSAFVTKYRVVQRLKKLSNGASIFQERPPGNCKNQSKCLWK